jgi:hypothetical protein
MVTKHVYISFKVVTKVHFNTLHNVLIWRMFSTSGHFVGGNKFTDIGIIVTRFVVTQNKDFYQQE